MLRSVTATVGMTQYAARNAYAMKSCVNVEAVGKQGL
jgi:hypothetical protein